MAWGHAMVQRYVKKQSGQATQGRVKMPPDYLKDLEPRIGLGSCKLCYAFEPRYVADLGVHVTLKHLPRQRGIIYCKWCDKNKETFANKGALFRHAAETQRQVRAAPAAHKVENPLGCYPTARW